jgi:hypothetical protein
VTAPLRARDRFTAHLTGAADFVNDKERFIHIPDGAEGLLVSPVSSREPGVETYEKYLWLQTLNPLGRYLLIRPGRSQILPMPRPGTFAAVVTGRDTPPGWVQSTPAGRIIRPLPYSLDLTVLGAQIHAPSSIAISQGESHSVPLAITNTFGPFEGGAVPLSIASVRTTRMRLDPQQQHVFDINVPEGSPLLAAELIGNTPHQGDVDLYLFDCTAKVCRTAYASPSLGVRPHIRRTRPKAGLWRVVVDASRVPADGVQIEYRDIVADPALGDVSVSDTMGPRATGSRWTTTATVRFDGAAPAGREPVALFAVGAMAERDQQLLPIGLRVVPLLPRPPLTR